MPMAVSRWASSNGLLSSLPLSYAGLEHEMTYRYNIVYSRKSQTVFAQMPCAISQGRAGSREHETVSRLLEPVPCGV